MPLPQLCPTPTELADLELLTSGAYAPVTTFNEDGSPITLSVPSELAGQPVELVDPEGLPLARLEPEGAVTVLTQAQFGPFRRLHLSPAQVREQYAGSTFVPVVDALTTADLDRLGSTPGRIVLLALIGPGTPEMSSVSLLRASLAAASHLTDAAVVAVPLASHGDAETDHALGTWVVDNYAAGDPVLGIGDVAPGAEYPDDIAAIVDFDAPPTDEQGLVLFFTGLSGSGKSTVAQAVMDALLEQGRRTITRLDGDVVRRNLSAGLTFSREDRETNIRRIGWVAAEISRHGGLAVCSPIAPFDQTRQQVRALTDDAGGAFFLVHVATPLEECERRDRKGLYAKARAGEIPEFTGISSPYEEPEDADLRIDTTGRSIQDCRDEVIDALQARGFLVSDLTTSAEPTESTEPSSSVEPSRDDDPLRVLFVCTANICRSPYLELRARQLLDGDATVVISSAGTHGHQDEPVSDSMEREFADRGIDAAAFRGRRVTRALVDEADVVLTAEAGHRAFLLEDQPGAFRKVFTLGQLSESLELVDPSLHGRALLEALNGRRAPAQAAHDIDDPYRKGPAEARTAATRMDQLLRTVLPRLARRDSPTSGILVK